MDGTASGAAPHPGSPDDGSAGAVSLRLRQVLLLAGDTRVALAQRMDLNPSEVDAMEHLMGEAMGPVELSRRLHMTSASATVLVDRLESAGHVRREPDPSDGRRRVIRPTDQGVTAVLAQVEPLVADLMAAEAALADRERDVVRAYLERVTEVLLAHAATADQP